MDCIIKWSGSKRPIAKEIVSKFPRQINIYFEPFLGGGSVLGELLSEMETGNIKCKKIVTSDLNGDLIGLWTLIKNNPQSLIGYYTNKYAIFSRLDIESKKNYFKAYRDIFNQKKDKGEFDIEYYCIFFWLLRTCFNGLVRYDKDGHFNTSCHFSRNGIMPDKIAKIIMRWSDLVNKYDVMFVKCSYDIIEPVSNEDFIYCDPPYNKSNGMYFKDGFEQNDFFEFLSNLKCGYAFSYDGQIENKDGEIIGDNTVNVDNVLFNEHIYINSGKSSFRKIKSQQSINVKESLYIKNLKKDEQD